MSGVNTKIELHDHCPVVHAGAPAGEHRCEACHMRMKSICSALDLHELSENEHLSDLPLRISSTVN